ncbi:MULTISPECIES: ABC transporter ATP-binding protein [Saccharibacillus]|uniref:ABC transporter ATP-binding protein n=1 Tax=Saccharibacillus TaxID=456492 RepID=UPI00123A89B0|nr:ABC transporter ATP-binding protein [Saccharibacillus sp. WB 17]MWJ30252.1 ATP-binding cassette domain-containing protein [Saccharibacillus sp. WB 17]
MRIKRELSLKKYLFKNKFLLGAAVVLSVASAAMNVALAFILKELIDIGVQGTFGELIDLVLLVLAFLGLFLIVGVLQYLFKNKYVQRSMIGYKDAISRKIIDKNLVDFRKRNTGSYISIMNNDAKIIETDYVSGNLILITQIAMFVMGLASIFYLNVQVAVVAILLSLLPVAASLALNGKVAFRQKKVSEKNEAFTMSIKDVFNGFTVIKSFGVEREVAQTVSEVNTELETRKKKYNDITALIGVLTETSGFIVVVGTFTFGTWLAIQGKITVGEVVAYIQLLNYLLGPIVIMAEYLNKRKAGAALIANIDEMLLAEEAEAPGRGKSEFEREIAFRDVGFSFDGERRVLDGLNVRLEKNKSYAVVGLSGSGKSTLLNLLMGYYENYDGAIQIDGTELRDIDPSDLYKLISVIQQEVFMFDAPIEDNILLYKTYPPEKLEQAIRMSGLDEFIARKSTKFHCGENGSFLSGGEKQRVSIARALIKETPILLLDEATSSLDNETAASIEKAILELQGITRVIVTHKLNKTALSMYDEIIMMKNGTVVEQGSFDELLERKGFFYSLYTITF